ncbi:MAG: hypothetical protein WD490_10570 [Opitutales bacterium]
MIEKPPLSQSPAPAAHIARARDDPTRAGLEASACLTAFGDERATWKALCEGRSCLKALPVRGEQGGEKAPLAVRGEMTCQLPQRWIGDLRTLANAADRYAGWGHPGFPVIMTSSNFSIESLYAHRVIGLGEEHTSWGAIHRCGDSLRRAFGWGPDLRILSHACVSASLGLRLAGRMLQTGDAQKVLVFSFDYLSPFVAAGFHSLKILNGDFPAPYQKRGTGSIGLGDGAGFAVLTKDAAPFALSHQVCWNEMFHLTGNEPGGSGFGFINRELTAGLGGRSAWIRGHGTGTLEAGRMECESWAAALPDAPLVAWKGGIGHTLGSCGIVELAIATTALREGKAPGTVASAAPFFTGQVAAEALDITGFDAAILTANAFGGAHSGLILTHG